MINERFARIIVENLKKIIDYDINIINKEGIIVDSTNFVRINTPHQGGKKAIITRETVEININNKFEKKGINIPIEFENEVIGAVGITGEPNELRNFGKVIKTMTELLIAEKARFLKIYDKNIDIENFLTKLVRYDSPYSEKIINHAKFLNLPLRDLTVGVVFYFESKKRDYIKQKLKSYLTQNEYLCIYNLNKIIVFTSCEKNLLTKISKINCNFYVGVGGKNSIISKSIKEGENGIKIGRILNDDKNIFIYKDYIFYHSLLKDSFNINYHNIYNRLVINDNLYIIDTIKTYVAYNGDVNKIAKKLNIHRNTLGYRLEKIFQLSGKNPRNYIELMELYCAILAYQWNNYNDTYI